MLDRVVGDEAQADEEGHAEEEAGGGDELGAVAVAEVADERAGKGREHEGQEDEARADRVPVEDLGDVEGEGAVEGGVDDGFDEGAPEGGGEARFLEEFPDGPEGVLTRLGGRRLSLRDCVLTLLFILLGLRGFSVFQL